MKTHDFNFTLPPELIAQHPPAERGSSRLMTVNRQSGRWEHRMVKDLPAVLSDASLAGASGRLPLLVFNNSKVRKARLFARSHSGALVEFLLLDELSDGSWKVLVQRAKRRKQGSLYVFFDAQGSEINRAEITGEDNEFRMLKFHRAIDEAWLDHYGHMPLPPYIKRSDTSDDAERYQTVYAAHSGSAAAPTAGLHFAKDLLAELAAYGIESAFVTLHVGLGTFLPVHAENIEDHRMHEEEFSIDNDTAEKIEGAVTQGRRIIAVGTTSLRTLESAFNDTLARGMGKTSIFIRPGYQFKIVNALFTNFHTPESTLLMLVSAFANAGSSDLNRGRELMLDCYSEAIREGYRFFSYGDAMLIY